MEKPMMVGWREWVSLPELSLGRIKAKIDTGAKTSALHAFYVKPYVSNGVERVAFGMHPVQQDDSIVVECDALLIDRRVVTNSGGDSETRCVIRTPVTLGKLTVTTDITLTNRDNMRFRMILGRRLLNHRVIVDPAASFLAED